MYTNEENGKKDIMKTKVIIALFIVSSIMFTSTAVSVSTKATIWHPAVTDYYSDSSYVHDLYHSPSYSVSIDVSQRYDSSAVYVGYYDTGGNQTIWASDSSSAGAYASASKNYSGWAVNSSSVYQELR